jgi:hypothetical protein
LIDVVERAGQSLPLIKFWSTSIYLKQLTTSGCSAYISVVQTRYWIGT